MRKFLSGNELIEVFRPSQESNSHISFQLQYREEIKMTIDFELCEINIPSLDQTGTWLWWSSLERTGMLW